MVRAHFKHTKETCNFKTLNLIILFFRLNKLNIQFSLSPFVQLLFKEC